MANVVFPNGITITVDVAHVAAPIQTGFDAAERDALADDTLVKVRDKATKSNLPVKFALSLQVSSFDPKHLGDKGNFFSYVTDWQTSLSLIREHLRAFYMETPFLIIKFELGAPPNPEQVRLLQVIKSKF